MHSWKAVHAGLLLAAMAMPAPAEADVLPSVTIIIDDLGYDLAAGRRAIALDGPVVCSVLPRTPGSEQLAELAHRRGKEVLLHLPLQAINEADDMRPGDIVLDMSQRRFSDTLAANLGTVPFAMGINGHRGSLLTRHPGHMGWLMSEISARGLVFVDSYTTHHSVALRMALEHGVAATRRDVFLDNDPREPAINREFERLIGLARLRGNAVGIGHPYPATLAFLERELPSLPSRGIRLAGLSELLRLGGRHLAQPVTTAEPEFAPGPAEPVSAASF